MAIRALVLGYGAIDDAGAGPEASHGMRLVRARRPISSARSVTGRAAVSTVAKLTRPGLGSGRAAAASAMVVRSAW
jgi:hypothetical protein